MTATPDRILYADMTWSPSGDPTDTSTGLAEAARHGSDDPEDPDSRRLLDLEDRAHLVARVATALDERDEARNVAAEYLADLAEVRRAVRDYVAAVVGHRLTAYDERWLALRRVAEQGTP